VDALWIFVIVVEGIGLLSDLISGAPVVGKLRDYSTCTAQACHDEVFPTKTIADG